MTKKKTFILGTRGSLLALTQSQQVASELERNSDISIEIKTIKTQGDLNTKLPLWQMDGKDFFTKELDQALCAGEIDFVVHSYKDLGSERPEGINIAAITERVVANDILFASKESIQNLHQKKEFIVGTSSPRRITNIEKSLSEYLPYGPNVKCKNLRGNVNTRLSKIQTKEYDAVVLAFAGLERLARDPKASEVLKELIKDLDFMILPSNDFPPAASQGALAIEYHQDNPHKEQLLKALQSIHCPQTKASTDIERKKFTSYGGGCHLAVGIHSSQEKDVQVFFEKGCVDKKEIDSCSLILTPKKQSIRDKLNTKNKHKIFIGLSPLAQLSWPGTEVILDSYIKKIPLCEQTQGNKDVLISTSYALNSLRKSQFEGHLWVSGSKTWKKLAKENVWVNGSCNSLGEQTIQYYRQSSLIQLKKPKEETSPISIFTHEKSKADISDSIITPSYKREIQEITPQFKKEVEECEIFYWTSFYQFKTYKENFSISSQAIHCCGLGKTYQEFLNNQIEVVPFLSMREFKQWITNQGKSL